MKIKKILFLIILVISIQCYKKKCFLPLNNVFYKVCILQQQWELDDGNDGYKWYDFYFIECNDTNVNNKKLLFNKNKINCLSLYIGNLNFNYFFRMNCEIIKWLDTKNGKNVNELLYMDLKVKFRVSEEIENLNKNNKLTYNISESFPMYLLDGHKFVINEHSYTDHGSTLNIDVCSYEPIK